MSLPTNQVVQAEKKRVLILGGTGYVGQHLAIRLAGLSIDHQYASRKASNAGQENALTLDTKNKQDLIKALTNIDVVVNCVAGDFNSISDGATCLVEAALECGKPLIIHMSSMAVYGHFEGTATEQTPLDPSLGWYALAKCQAEQQINQYCAQGGRAIILRPGCVYGANSELWVGRISRWLKARRIGDIGAAGDGWSNLIHIDDVVTAIVASFYINSQTNQAEVFNLATPDSPRWNQYFTDLAVKTNAVPVRRVKATQLLVDAYFYSPPAKFIEILAKKLNASSHLQLNPLPPALLKFFKQQIKLDSTKAQQLLLKNWVSYQQGLEELGA